MMEQPEIMDLDPTAAVRRIREVAEPTSDTWRTLDRYFQVHLLRQMMHNEEGNRTLAMALIEAEEWAFKSKNDWFRSRWTGFLDLLVVKTWKRLV